MRKIAERNIILELIHPKKEIDTFTSCNNCYYNNNNNICKLSKMSILDFVKSKYNCMTYSYSDHWEISRLNIKIL